MTPDQVTLVQESFKKVVPIAGKAADLFYDRLFTIAPEVRSLFPADLVGAEEETDAGARDRGDQPASGRESPAGGRGAGTQARRLWRDRKALRAGRRRTSVDTRARPGPRLQPAGQGGVDGDLHNRCRRHDQSRRHRRRRRRGDAMSGDFTPEQKRYLEGFTAGLQIARAARNGESVRRHGRAGRPRRDPLQGAGPHRQGRRQALRPGEIQARAASVRRLWAAEGAGRQERSAEGGGQFPLALLRPVLLRAGAELLYVPAAHRRTAFSRIGSSHGLADSRRPLRRTATPTSPRAPTCRCARSSRRTRSRWSRGSRTSACARAAPAPTTSATSPARRPPASTRRS